jgi:hypothetical protein
MAGHQARHPVTSHRDASPLQGAPHLARALRPGSAVRVPRTGTAADRSASVEPTWPGRPFRTLIRTLTSRNPLDLAGAHRNNRTQPEPTGRLPRFRYAVPIPSCRGPGARSPRRRVRSSPSVRPTRTTRRRQRLPHAAGRAVASGTGAGSPSNVGHYPEAGQPARDQPGHGVEDMRRKWREDAQPGLR